MSTGLAFENGEPVLTADFDYPVEGDVAPAEIAQGDAAAVRRETLFRLLHFLTSKAGVKQSGQRTLVLAFLAGATSYRKQKQLASKLRVTPSRCSRIVNSVKGDFDRLARGN